MTIATPSVPAPAFSTPATGSRTLYDIVPSPIGELLLTADGAALTGLHMIGRGSGERADDRSAPSDVAAAEAHMSEAGAIHEPEAFAEAREQLGAYFAGELTAFRLPLAPRGTPFQLAVWRALCDIPYGTTASYGDLAAAVGRGPSASRAIGAANGRNPIAVIVPCHRVIGATGSLVGFGGGLERKRRLLELEGAILL